jgi:hypothetical protein
MASSAFSSLTLFSRSRRFAQPLVLAAPSFVLLSAEQERQALDALTELFANADFHAAKSALF